MGCFDYKCDGCDGYVCHHSGGQNRSAIVIIEVPLSDETVVYLEGEYEECGYVTVKLNKTEYYEFYPIQFEEYFKDWFERESEKERRIKFISHNIYTVKEKVHVSELDDDAEDDVYVTKTYNCNPSKSVPLTKNILSKCIRADKDLGLPSYVEQLKRDIQNSEYKIKLEQERLEKIKKELEEELELLNPKEKVVERKRRKSPKTLNV